MLGYKHQIMGKFYEPYLRLHQLSSSEYGFIPGDDDYYFDRMNSLMDSFSNNSQPYELYDRLLQVPYPDLERSKQVDLNRSSDILLKDIGRQYHSIEERFRKNQISLPDLRRLNDGAPRYLWSTSRGFDRTVINRINQLDGEMLTRKTVKPLI